MNAAALHLPASPLRRPVRVASAARTVCRIGAIAALLLVAACARPTGDFGRAAPSFDHDVVMPAIGKQRAIGRGEPVSSFNQTDQEKLMHNRVWRFLVAAHSKDWFYDTAVEFQRTRITPATDYQFDVNRYYNWLRKTEYASSRVRYQTVKRHVDTDIATIPETFAAICAVEEVDRQRAISAQALSGADLAALGNVGARKAENDMTIGWFVRALRYRYGSYTFALDHLLVETPHEEARQVDASLAKMAVYLRRAESRDFCGGSGLVIGEGGGASLPSRVLLTPAGDEYLK